MRHLIKKVCVVCKKEFEVKNSGYHEKIKSKRGKNAITCSRECSRELQRNRLLYSATPMEEREAE